MKTLNLSWIALSALFIGFPVKAQNRIGFVGGLSLTKISAEPEPTDFSYSSRNGFGIGTFFERDLGQSAAIRFESSYVQKGGSLSTSIYDYYSGYDIDVEAAIKLGYIETATMLVISPGRSTTRPYLMVGPAISYLISAKFAATASAGEYSETESVDIADVMNEIDFGFTFGGGIRFDYVFVEARYALGLSDITKDVEVEELNRGFQIMAGISAPIGR